MIPAERLVQRYHDGELDRLQHAALSNLLQSDERLNRCSARLGKLDQLMCKHVSEKKPFAEPADFAAHFMARLPNEMPVTRPGISVAHITLGFMSVVMVACTAALADLLRAWIDVEGIAAGCALVGLALVVAARPLAGVENSLLARLLMKRVVVGDGEVLVCRVLGLALIVGAAHIAGLWS